MSQNDDLLSQCIQIDAIDQQLLMLLNERAKHAIEIGKIKIKQQGEKAELYRPEREAQILKNLVMQNKGPLGAKEITNIFRMIMNECRHLEILHQQEQKHD